MAKIVMTNIYLVNWYGFINTKIPVGKDLTLITGENECGKSTILDAVKYAFTGDSEFNKSSSVHNVGGSRRTLPSYTRCLIDASAGIYARPAEKIPNVYSHIALEYYDEANNNHFVLGVILETNSSNTVNTYWYAFDHTDMGQIQFVYQDAGVVKPYDSQKFQKKYGIQLMIRKDALSRFMNMTGLKFAYAEIGKFQRKLRNIMTYNPAAKIQQFIKESVLEDHDINFDKLRDAKNNIEKINTTLSLIKAEVDALDDILANYAEHERIHTRLLIDDAKQVYKAVLQLRGTIKTTKTQIENNQSEIEHLGTVINDMITERNELDTRLLKAKNNLLQLDCSRAIEEEKENQKQLLQQKKKLEEDKEVLRAFQAKVNEMLVILQNVNVKMEKDEILKKLSSRDYTFVEKKNATEILRKSMLEQRDHLLKAGYDIQSRLTGIQEELIHYNEVVAACEKNKPDYSAVQEQIALLREINKEFQNRNIHSEAKFACEYVVKIEEEEWRAAIEAFLGIHRYSIIVEPQYFEIANKLIDKSSHKFVELVNTRLLSQRNLKREEDSVVNKLLIKNDIAQKYFNFWLGKIHAVDISEVARYENALSKEGKLSRNMAVTYINLKKIKTYCMGQEAIEINRNSALKQIRELEQQEKAILAEQEKKKALEQRTADLLEYFKEYNFDAEAEYGVWTRNWNESEANLKRLLKAQEKNEEFQTLANQVKELEETLGSLNKHIEDKKDKKRDLESDNKRFQDHINSHQQTLKEKEEKLENQRLVHAYEVKTAEKEYDEYMNNISKAGDVMISGTRERTERRKRELETNIVGGQKLYNNKKKPEDQLPEGMEFEGRYLARKNKIWVDDLQDINAKMAEQTRKYESIFKNEFVLSLYQTALSAKEDISGINKELRKLQFATKYQFDVNLLDDKSDYAKILRYAEFLKKTNKVDDGQMVFGNLYGYEDDEVEQREKEIKEIINRIIEKNDVGVIQSFADYRNYMSYEIIINNADVKDGKLSKQAGYNSGAGTQIPYTLILSAALSMLYNARVNTTRLIFIDEPFEKMSDHNIKLMLTFFKNQDFQVIFCAPPNKTDSIGYECDTIIPVLKIGNDNMQIGSVQFYDRK